MSNHSPSYQVRRLSVPRALPHGRVVALLVVTMVVAAGLVVRLFTLQVTPPDRLIEFGASRATRSIDVAAPRGTIVDRYGRDLVLNEQAMTVVANPQLLTDVVAAAAQLAPIFSLATTELEQRLSRGKDSGSQFAYVARQVSSAQAAAALGLGIDGIATIEEPARVKPTGPLVAASVLGQTDVDNVGRSGVERQYDAVLAGTKGKVLVEEGTKGRTIPGASRAGTPAVSGTGLVLTLDRVLQFEVDELLAQAVTKANAQYGVAIVSRVGSSEILANSVVSRLDGEAAEPTVENRAVTWGLEPGSVMKALTISALIDSGTVSVDSVFDVPSQLRVYDVTYADDRPHPTQPMTAEAIIQQSSNVGTILMAQQLGDAKLQEYLTRFGLGAPTGLGFPGESSGYVGDYRRWDGTTLSSYAIGQGIVATPMQMLMALNAIANDGLYVAPRYVLGSQTADGKFVAEPAPEQRRVISPESAGDVRTILQSVVTGGTGSAAQVPGFSVAGKTGTAWKAQNPHWVDDNYRDTEGRRHLSSSFMGFLPADDPQLSIMVILDDLTNLDASGGKVAAPVFSTIADIATRQLGITATTGIAATPQRVRAQPEVPPPPPTVGPTQSAAALDPAVAAAPTITVATQTTSPTTTRPRAAPTSVRPR